MPMMHDKPTDDAKLPSLKAQGCLNRRPEAVTDLLFHEDDFFDPRDLVQVKYEMLRRVRHEGLPVSRASAAFGLSRPAYYQAQFAFEREGLPGLIPKKRGPRSGHKLTEEVVQFVVQERTKDSSMGVSELAGLVAGRFGVKVHPRSVERALLRLKKKPV
jgi:transposase